MIDKQSISDIEDWNKIASNYAQVDTNNHIYKMFENVLWDCLGNVQSLDILDHG